MSTSELESEFARISLGMLPASAVPKNVMHQIDFVSWDHQIFPGLVWRIPDPSLPEIRYHDAGMIEGLRVQEFERVIILVEEKIRAVIPNGDWILKREAGMKEERGAKTQKMELIWVDKRQFETSRRIPGVKTQDGAVMDLDCTLLFRIVDPVTLVRNLILDEGKYLEKDVDQKIYEVMEEVVISEISKNRASDIHKLENGVRESLNKEMSNWGMEAAGLKLNSVLQTRGQIQPALREPSPGIEATKPMQQTAFKSLAKKEQQAVASRGLSPEAEWEARTKKWVPLSKRGEVKCDGCANDVDWFAECDQNCRSTGRCKLCKECYLKRKMCAFA